MSFESRLEFKSAQGKATISLPARWHLESAERQYDMEIYVDLIGGCFHLRRGWSGLFNQRGGGKTHQFFNFEQAWLFVEKILIKRLNHGYSIQHEPLLAMGAHELDRRELRDQFDRDVRIARQAIHPNSLLNKRAPQVFRQKARKTKGTEVPL